MFSSTKLHCFWMEKVLCDRYQVALCLHAYVFCVIDQYQVAFAHIIVLSVPACCSVRMQEFLCGWYQVVLCLDARVSVRSVPSSNVSGMKEHLGSSGGWHCRLELSYCFDDLADHETVL